MKGILKIMLLKGKGFINGRMGGFMKGNGLRIK